MALTRITKGVIKPNENYDTHNINSTGIVTALGLDVNGNGDISGDLNVGGILTYEDVTSIDAVGIITAQQGIHVGAGVSAVGVGTFSGLDISGDIDVDGHTNLDNVSIAGVTTASGGVRVNADGSNSANYISAGASDDLKLYHSSGGNSIIHNSTGYLELNANAAAWIKTTQFNIIDNDATHYHIRTFKNDRVELYHNNVKRLETTSQGIEITGHSELDNVSVAGVSTFASNVIVNGGISNAQYLNLSALAPSIDFNDTNHNSDFMLQNANGLFKLYDNTNSADRVTVASNGNVSVKKDLDVDGHTNLDNVNIAGVTTSTGNIYADNYFGNGGLTLNNNGNPSLNLTSTSTTGSSRINFGDPDSGSVGKIYYAHNGDYIHFNTAYNERLRIGSAGQLGIGGANYGSSGQVLTSGGSGATVSWSTITGTTINNNADNRIITGSGTANTLNGESTLTYDGTSIFELQPSSATPARFIGDANRTGQGQHLAQFEGNWNGTLVGRMVVVAGEDTSNKDDGHLDFYTTPSGGSNTRRVRITSAGRMGINETSPDSLLHVRNDNSYAAKFGGEGGGSEYYMEIGQLATSGSAGFNATGVSGSMLFKINGSEKLRIDPDGDLGLGDTNPNIRLTVVDTGTENLVRLGRSDASGHASHTVNVKASKDFYHNFKMEASSYNLDCYNGSAMIEAFKVHNTGFAEFAGASDVRLTLGNYGTAGSNGANWLRGVSNSLYYNAGAGSHLWEIAGAEHMQLRSDGNLYLRSESANYVVLGSNGSATSSGISNNMNWIRGNGANTQYNTSGGFHAWEVSGSEKLRLAADGKVGMGAQTNPQGNLDIRTTDEDDAIRLVNTSTGNNGIQWWNEYGGLTKRVSMDYGEGDANFDIACFRGDAQDNRPYGNVRILTGSYSSPSVNFRVTTLGTVHMPNQPSFSASRSSGHVYGNNPPTAMVFNSVDFNVGNNYDNSNGIFTAPIAGKYQFSFCGMAAGGSGDFQVRLLKNGGGLFNNNGSGRGYGTFEPYGFTVLVDMAINDTVQIKIYSSNTSCYIYAGTIWNKFSGHLVG